MSTHKTIIEIEPPSQCSEEAKRESFYIKNQTCGYCLGRGWFYRDIDDESETCACPMCKGTGMVDAMVSVKWSASKQR